MFIYDAHEALNNGNCWRQNPYKDNYQFEYLEHIVISKIAGFEAFISAVSHLLNPALSKDACKVTVKDHRNNDCNLVKFLQSQPVFMHIKEEAAKRLGYRNAAAAKFEQYLEERRETFSTKSLDKLGWSKQAVVNGSLREFFKVTTKEQALVAALSSASQPIMPLGNVNLNINRSSSSSLSDSLSLVAKKPSSQINVAKKIKPLLPLRVSFRKKVQL